jgi:glyoxylase-like metal-dependent hydrolase (beta-lactamase superfamily II)
VDLGPKTLEYTNGMFRRHGFFRDLGPGRPAAERYPDDIAQPEGNVFRHLERLKLSPAAIGHVVFTHLHADHHGMDDAKDGGAAEEFKDAVLHISARGWKENLASRLDGRWGSYVDFAFSDFLLRRERAGKVRFEDDAEVFPGLRTMYLGGHSPCSQAVIVETAAGPAIIASDDVYLYELLEKDIVPRIRTSTEAYRKAVDRLAGLAAAAKAVILPLHDPSIWDAWRKAGEGWLEELRPRSDRAVTAYLAARARRAAAKRAFKGARGRARPGCSGRAPRRPA